jgi:micrococcal nuclease
MARYRRSGSVYTFSRFMAGGLAAIAIWLILPEDKRRALEETAIASIAPGAARQSTEPASHQPYSTRFTYCNGSAADNCVVDGDTFHFQGKKIRIADIDTPEIHPPRCEHERQLGEAAKTQLLALLNEAPFELALYDNRDEDKYGRKLRVVLRDGRSLGGELVELGLARHWEGKRRSWCD